MTAQNPTTKCEKTPPASLCYGCWFKGGYQEGCGCTVDPEGPCPSEDALESKHEWDILTARAYEESEPECIGRRCELCGVCDIS